MLYESIRYSMNTIVLSITMSNANEDISSDDGDELKYEYPSNDNDNEDGNDFCDNDGKINFLQNKTISFESIQFRL